jgi:hypothetical protein
LEESMPVEIVGELKRPLDEIVREVLHKALDARTAKFEVHISQPHTELIVHVQKPFDRRLKFNALSEREIGRELYTAVTEIAQEGDDE